MRLPLIMVLTLWQLLETGICEEHVRCACHTLQLFIKNYIDPAKPKNAPAGPTNPTSDLVSTFQKLVNKIHASPLMTENLSTAQIGGPAAEQRQMKITLMTLSGNQTSY